MGELETRFVRFMKETMPANPVKSEFYLPFAVEEMLREGRCDVKVLQTPDQWYGVTYPQDKASVCAAIEKMKADGIYRRYLWTDRI